MSYPEREAGYGCPDYSATPCAICNVPMEDHRHQFVPTENGRDACEDCGEPRAAHEIDHDWELPEEDFDEP